MGWRCESSSLSGYSQPQRSASSGNRAARLSAVRSIQSSCLLPRSAAGRNTETWPVGMFPEIYLLEAKQPLRERFPYGAFDRKFGVFESGKNVD